MLAVTLKNVLTNSFPVFRAAAMAPGTLSGLAQSLSESVTALVQREGGWDGDAGWSTLGASALGSVKLVSLAT